MRRSPTPDQRADELASRQYGAISLTQALDVSLTSGQVRWRVRTGRWRQVTRGVYYVAGAPPTWQQAAVAACLAGPPGTVVSHLTAAALFGLWKPPPLPHVTVPPGASGRFPVAIAHHAPLETLDRCLVGRIPATAPARTILDCAALLGYGSLCDLVDDALCRSLTDVSALRAAAVRAGRGRKGLRHLEQALAVWTPGPLPGSPAEMRLIRRLLAWGFPMPERQLVIRDHRGRFVARVDIGWRPWRAGIEYDGKRHHGPRRWEADDARQDRIEAVGWRIERAGEADLRPGVTRLRDILAPLLAACPPYAG